MMQYGQRRPEQQGTMLEVMDGQLVEKIPFALPRGGVITGQVTDEFGEPLAGAQVSALRFRYMSGARRLMATGGGTTDDRGAFRIYGLIPGEYFVSGALRTQPMIGMGTSSVASSNVEGYAPTYYPGTANAVEAQLIVMKVGQETTNVSFSLAATRLVRVAGRAISSSGEPHVQAFVSVSRRIDTRCPSAFNGANTRADGTFQLVGPRAQDLKIRRQ